MKWLIYLSIGVFLSLPVKMEKDNSIWTSPYVIVFILFWPIFLLVAWAKVKVIRWKGKEVWRRK